MEQLGVDLNAGGAVMSRSELEEQRRKRGECLTCGIKCFNRKVFKMIPITEPGRVHEGRCLACRPRDDRPGTGGGTGRESVRVNGVSRRSSDAAAATTVAALAGMEIAKNYRNKKMEAARKAQSHRGMFEPNQSAGVVVDPQSSRSLDAPPRQSAGRGRLDRGGAVNMASPERLQPQRASSSTVDGEEERRLIGRLNESNLPHDEILIVMRSMTDSASVQEEALLALSELHLGDGAAVAEDDGGDDIAARFASAGGPKAVLAAMKAHANRIEVQIAGCQALGNLSATSPEVQASLGKLGGVGSIVTAMSAHEGDAHLQENAISALANLGACSANHPLFLVEGGIKKIVEAMSCHSDCITVLETGCEALSSLAASGDASIRGAIAKAGGANAVVISMVMNPACVELQKRSLRSLRNLCAGDGRGCAAVADAGGIDAVVGAMQVHRDEVEVQEGGAFALSHLAIDSKHKALVGDSGGIDVVIRAMWVHSEHPGVQQWSCRALRTLSLEPENETIIIDVGGISAVVNALQAHVDTAGVQEAGLGVLSNLASDNDAIKCRIVDEEALDAIVLAMVIHSEAKVVQEQACILLQNLVHESNIQAMQAANVAALMSSAAENFPAQCRKKAEATIPLLAVD